MDTNTVTDITVGTHVTITAGFAQGETGQVEALYPNALGGPAVIVLLPIYGLRRFPLEYVKPLTAHAAA